MAEAEHSRDEDIGSLERVLDRAEIIEGLDTSKELSDSETTSAKQKEPCREWGLGFVGYGG